MPDIASGIKKKLTISPCKVEGGNTSVDTSKQVFEALVNPSEYRHVFNIEYNQDKALGENKSGANFSAMGPETVSVNNLVLDGTGIVGSANVKTLVNRLYDAIYKYDGAKHEPNVVRLLWGSLIFFGRATSLDIAYTLFKPSGEPLRAKANLSFIGWTSSEEATLTAGRSSPDLSHIVEIRAGDTLPLLCHRIYGNAAYYAEVAKHNGIVNFRNLEPGSKIHFPPLG
jgi:hypothetical protein